MMGSVVDWEPPPSPSYRFGIFEVDAAGAELRRRGARIRIQEKPLQALLLLLERAGEVVTREEFRHRLWPADTFVDFDVNLNAAIKRLREALGDTAGVPRYIETIPRRGYRFLLPVERGDTAAAPVPVAARSRSRWRLASAGISLAIIAGVALGALSVLRKKAESGATKPLIAVLPFRNLTGDNGQGFLADGLTDELIAQLGRMPPGRLGVTPRAALQNVRHDLGATGRRFGLSYVIEGSVRRSRDVLRFTAQLVQVRGHSLIWSEIYDRSAYDVVAAQREVARRVAQALALELLPGDPAALARATTLDTDAYEAYVRGLSFLKRQMADSLEPALECFQGAIRLDPAYAVAYDGLASTYLGLADFRAWPREAALNLADAAIAKALEMDRSVPYSYALRAAVLRRLDPKSPLIDATYQYALTRNPGFASLHNDYAVYLASVDRWQQAIEQMNHAVDLDSQSPRAHAYLAWLLYRTGRATESRAHADRALELDPRCDLALKVLASLRYLHLLVLPRPLQGMCF